MTVRRLFPEPAVESSVDESTTALAEPPPDRPWVGLTMIASLDGSISVDGRSGGLGNDTDAAVLSAFRRCADVILVGASTIRVEGYGAPRRAGLRVGVVSRSGRVDTTTPLFTSGAGFLIVPHDAPPSDVETLRAGQGDVDLTLALARLGEIVDAPRRVQAEGGASLNAALLAADVLDELDLTVSPRVVGGDGKRLVVGPPVDRRFQLAQLCIDDDGYVFTRWLRRRQTTSTATESTATPV
jgi:riboflavin biosynthesis pyrimidine reductase